MEARVEETCSASGETVTFCKTHTQLHYHAVDSNRFINAGAHTLR